MSPFLAEKKIILILPCNEKRGLQNESGWVNGYSIGLTMYPGRDPCSP